MSMLLDTILVLMFTMMLIVVILLLVLLGMVVRGVWFDDKARVQRELDQIRSEGAIMDSQGVLFVGREAPHVGVPEGDGVHHRSDLGHHVPSDYRGESD